MSQSIRRVAAAAGAVAALALSASSAQAAAAPPWQEGWIVPTGTQAGSGTFPVKCTVVAGGITLATSSMDVTFSGAMPTNAAAGQSFYVKGKTRIAIPGSLVSLMRLIGANAIEGRADKVQLTASGGTPSTVSVTDGTGPGVAVPRTTLPGLGKTLNLLVPRSGDLTIGPITANADAHTVDVALGAISAKITLIGYNGRPTFVPISISCPQVKPIAYLADVAVGGPPNSTPIVPQGGWPIKDVPSGSLVGNTGAGYQCEFDGLGSYPVPISLTASGSGLVTKSGKPYAFGSPHGSALVDPGLLAAVKASRGADATRATQFGVTISRLDVLAENSTPLIQNIAATPIPSGLQPVAQSDTAQVRFPKTGYLPEIPFIAGSPGNTYIFLGGTAGSVQVYDATGSPVGGPIGFDCAAPEPHVPLFPAVVL